MRGIRRENIILFENRGWTIVYQIRHVARGQVTFAPPSLDREFTAPQPELERILMAHGLFLTEAKGSATRGSGTCAARRITDG